MQFWFFEKREDGTPKFEIQKKIMPKVCSTLAHVCPDFNYFAHLLLRLKTQFWFFKKREVGTPKFEIQK